MSDYSMMGSFSTGGAKSLNGDLINKLKDSEIKAKIAPIDKKLEIWELNSKVMLDVNEKLSKFQEQAKKFDLFGAENNVFDQVTASTTGDSAIFDALDVGALKEGTINVNITQLAQKDVWQSGIFSDPDEQVDGGDDSGDNIIIKIDLNGDGDTDDSGESTTFTTVKKSYKDLAKDIELNTNFSASVEAVGDVNNDGQTDYRLVIKSKQEGKSISITENGVDLEINKTHEKDNGDGTTTTVYDNHVLVAQNMIANVDGVVYDVSSNNITIDGNLKITGTKEGKSSISIQKDSSQVSMQISDLVQSYNDLYDIINSEDSAKLENLSDIKGILNSIKSKFYVSHGDNNASLFSYGMSFDRSGHIIVDEKALGEGLTSNFDDIKGIFIGTAESKGVGTLLKEYLDDVMGFKGEWVSLTNNMLESKTKLEENKEKYAKDLDTKYNTMAAQFAAYGAMITQMESSFGGLKMMIAQSQNS